MSSLNFSTNVRATLCALLILGTTPALAQHEHHHHAGMDMGKSTSMGLNSPLNCGESERLNLSSGMCEPLPSAGQDVERYMVHGNAFAVGITQSGPRGRDGFAVPNMIMAEAGRSFGGAQFFSVNLMLTGELWSVPKHGYPLLLQTGEANRDGEPYIDAQHPHSSPIMGLTFSDTFRLSDATHLSLSFAPRGEATEGPIAFMHRPTGMVNPDAPLGHHIGQDVGHITSTVASASLGWRQWLFDASAFNGREPEPNKIDLPVNRLNSTAARVGYRLEPRTLLVASISYVKDPEDGILYYRRHSASLYTTRELAAWTWQNALIFGYVQNYDHLRNLSSVAEEFTLGQGNSTWWGRYEVLERAGTQLEVLPARGDTHWINVVTVGYTQALAQGRGVEIKAGASLTKYFLPRDFHETYGADPWAVKAFLQLSGMAMQ